MSYDLQATQKDLETKRRRENDGNLATYPFSISVMKDSPFSAVVTKCHIIGRNIVAPETTKQ